MVDGVRPLVLHLFVVGGFELLCPRVVLGRLLVDHLCRNVLDAGCAFVGYYFRSREWLLCDRCHVG